MYDVVKSNNPIPNMALSLRAVCGRGQRESAVFRSFVALLVEVNDN